MLRAFGCARLSIYLVSKPQICLSVVCRACVPCFCFCYLMFTLPSSPACRLLLRSSHASALDMCMQEGLPMQFQDLAKHKLAPLQV